MGVCTTAGSKFLFILSSPNNHTCMLARANHKACWLRHPPSQRDREIPPMGNPYYVMTHYRSRVGGEKKKVKVRVSLLGVACVLRFRGVPIPHHQVLLDERCSIGARTGLIPNKTRGKPLKRGWPGQIQLVDKRHVVGENSEALLSWQREQGAKDRLKKN